jgi:serralysin
VTGPGKGAPEVRVFDGVDLAFIGSFLAYDAKSKRGVRVAVGDVNGDGRAEIVTAPGRGPAEVRAFDGVSFEQVEGFPAFEPGFKKAAFVGAARP